MDKMSSAILNQSYVDDIMGSKDTIDKMLETMMEIEKILDTARFNIKAWHSNKKGLDQSEERQTKVLGLLWDKNQDSMAVKIPTLKGPKYMQRIILSNLSKFWDPLGLIMPVLVQLKTKLQGLWDDQLEWDDEIKEDKEVWNKLFQDVVKIIDNIEVKRPIFTKQKRKVSLHCFMDASDEA